MVSVANGVYIQDINGRLYKKGQYDGSVPVNGIAVITDDCSFVGSIYALANTNWFITPSQAAKLSSLRPDTNSLWQGIPIYSTSASAVGDFKGIENTANLVSALEGKVIETFDFSNGLEEYTIALSATEYCVNYTFPNGQSGYLGSGGELLTWMDYLDAISDLVGDVGFGTDDSKNTHRYWTSNRASNISNVVYYYTTAATRVNLQNTLITPSDYDTTQYYFRPFTALQSPSIVSVPTATCTISTYRGALRTSVPVASDVTVVARTYESGAWRTPSFVIPSGKTNVYWGNGIIGGTDISITHIYPSYDWKYKYVLGALE